MKIGHYILEFAIVQDIKDISAYWEMQLLSF